jgi:hypothetical protein
MWCIYVLSCCFRWNQHSYTTGAFWRPWDSLGECGTGTSHKASQRHGDPLQKGTPWRRMCDPSLGCTGLPSRCHFHNVTNTYQPAGMAPGHQTIILGWLQQASAGPAMLSPAHQTAILRASPPSGTALGHKRTHLNQAPTFPEPLQHMVPTS